MISKCSYIKVMGLLMSDISLAFIPPIYIYVTLPNNEYIFFSLKKAFSWFEIFQI